MEDKKIFLVILLSLVLIFILVEIALIVRDHIKRLKAHELSNCTDIFIENRCGTVIYVDGKQGAGKTTGSSGIIHSIVRVLIRKGQNIISNFREYFYKLDFNEIDKFIEQSYNNAFNNNYEPYTYISSIIVAKFPLIAELSHDNYLSVTRAEDMINDYIMAYIRLKDFNFVLSNIKIFNRITNNYNLHYDNEFIQLKKQYQKHSFYLNNYLIIFEDERSLNNYLASEYREVAKEDTGTKEFLRLARNAFKETLYYVATNQNTGRNVKEERELGTSYIHMEYMEVIGNHPTLTKIIGFNKLINNKIMNIFAFFHFKKKNDYLNKYNRFKSINYFYLKLVAKLFAKSYLKYSAKVYFDEKDIEKENTDNKLYYIPFDFVFPTSECFGTLDTHFYSFLVDILRNNAEYCFYNLEEVNAILDLSLKERIANNILQRKGEKTHVSNIPGAPEEDTDVFS